MLKIKFISLLEILRVLSLTGELFNLSFILPDEYDKTMFLKIKKFAF